MRSATTIIRSVIEGMRLEMKVRGSEIYTPGEGDVQEGDFKIYVDYTYYLCQSLPITIGGVDYIIRDVDIDNWIVVSGDSSLSRGTYTLRNPHFKHGKFQQYNEEFVQEFMTTDQNLSSPFVYNVETQNRTQPAEVDSLIDSEGDMRFIVYNGDDVQDKIIEKTTTDVLAPLHRWIDAFEQALEKSYDIHDVLTVNRIDHRKLDTKRDEMNKDRGAMLFNGKYSGVEVIMNIQIKIQMSCPQRDLPPTGGRAYSDGYSDGYA